MIDMLAAAIIAMATPQLAPVDTTTVIQEDDPRWDCRVDGNRICGPGAVLPDGSLAIPGDYTTVWSDGSPAWPAGDLS